MRHDGTIMVVFSGDKGVVLNSSVEYDSNFLGLPGDDAILCIISIVSIKIYLILFFVLRKESVCQL